MKPSNALVAEAREFVTAFIGQYRFVGPERFENIAKCVAAFTASKLQAQAREIASDLCLFRGDIEPNAIVAFNAYIAKLRSPALPDPVDEKGLPDKERLRKTLAECTTNAVEAVTRRERLPYERPINREALRYKNEASTWYAQYQAWMKRGTEAEQRETDQAARISELEAENRKMQNALEGISGTISADYAIRRANECLAEIGVEGYGTLESLNACCGERPHVREVIFTGSKIEYQVECPVACCEPADWSDTKQEAIDAWNTATKQP